MNTPANDKINYNKVLSSVAYDMRNSLTLMFQTLQNIASQLENNQQLTSEEIVDMNYQVQRLNGGLTQLMSLHSADDDKLAINVTTELVKDMLESVICQNDLFSSAKGISIELIAPDDLTWCFDQDLLSFLIDDVLSNAIRYSRQKIIIKVDIVDGMLTIEILDDSPGYPKAMLDAAAESTDITQLTSSFGRMGIGLLFSKLIVFAHKNQTLHGQIELSNDSQLGGSSFIIKLP
ncbi:sensor histidine kinase KdpD [Psychrobium sp. 1_MG-2023]|uniref:sensor histidine kinase n=1 Tax=Psychrobium sp. 1_MG-2023 TaxID=3062624 RepID=UPI000C34B1D7|nr:HAMP domain-containing sensor histidine kinase [Psychrobium sp. 1_MG-2023]MDP2560208.1 HAMP domain-containing sensor histidine kinase [Psychrobium sp. 1_MG-2023]PKF57019.1 hypothetical protein CW748_07945 [Alteromonadales bacterium alter-6D02]